MSDSKWYNVATFSISGEAREEFEAMRDATNERSSVRVVTERGVAYRVVPQDRANDTIAVWGISDHEHPRTGYSRFKALGNAEYSTVPLRTLARLARRRVAALVRGVIR